MNTRRTASGLAALAAMALVATACGSSSPSSTAPSSGGSSGPSLPNLSGKSVSVEAVWTGAEQATFMKVAKGFESATGATVNYTSDGDNLPTVLATKVSGGSPPDIGVLPQPGLMAQFAQAGNLKPADSSVSQAISANYPSIWKQLGSVNNKLYGVWVDASNKSTTWYNPALYSQAGITSVPQDWPTFVKDLGTLSDSGVTVPLSIGGADGWTLTDWFENVYIRTAGTAMYDKLTKHQIPWTDPSVIKALNILKALWSNQRYIGSPASALQVDFPTSVANVFSSKAKSAVVYEGSFVAAAITDKSFKPGTTAKWFPFPSINGSGPSVVGGGDVAVTFTGTPAAEAFLAYLASPAAAAAMVSTGSFTSANKSLNPSAYPDSNSRSVGQAIVNAGNNFRFDMSDQEPSAFGGTPGAGEWKDLQDFLSNPSNPAATARQLEADAAKAYK
ncbi:MAG: ABC transporter substrate-binding protein [Nocardioidaceae bacterium]